MKELYLMDEILPTLVDERLQMTSIPKIIMQTWKNTIIPLKWKTSPESISRYMPDWMYALMTDDDNLRFVQEHFPQYVKMYESFPHAIQRADIIRYMWLYVHGGLYLDLDYELQEPLDKLFYIDADLYFMNSNNVGAYITNSIMACKPYHPFWLELLEAIEENQQNPKFWAKGKHLEVMMSTGPGILSQVLRSSKHSYHTISQKLLCPQSTCHEPNYGGMMRLLEGSSWAEWDTKTMNWCYCNPEMAIIVGLLMFLFLILLLVMVARAFRR